jgi:hypothetical protein
MNKLLNITLILAALTGSAPAMLQARDYEFTVDRYRSPFMGSNLMMSGLSAYQTMDDLWLPSTLGETCAKAVFARGGKLVFEYFLSSWAMVAQHEYFGHGSRAREFHMYNVSYEINPLHGSTYYSAGTLNALNINQKAALSAGGMEATSILTREMESKILESDEIDSRQAMLLLVNALDQTTYIFGTSEDEFHADSNNDIAAYINAVNTWQGGSPTLNVKKLRHKMLWDLANPMLYLSLYSLYKYLWEGEMTTEYSRLFMGNMSFMPTTRTLLAPWGPEFQLLNHFYNVDEKYFGVYLRTGHTGGKTSYGTELHIYPLAQYENWSLGNRASVWHQPHILKSSTGRNNKSKFGFGEFLSLNYKFTESVSSVTEVGYKTSGYLPGTPLTKGVVWRVGFKINFDLKREGCRPDSEPPKSNGC